MKNEIRAIYISMLSEDYMMIEGPIKQCIEDYHIGVLTTMPGKQFAKVILRNIIHNLRMDGIK